MERPTSDDIREDRDDAPRGLSITIDTSRQSCLFESTETGVLNVVVDGQDRSSTFGSQPHPLLFACARILVFGGGEAVFRTAEETWELPEGSVVITADGTAILESRGRARYHPGRGEVEGSDAVLTQTLQGRCEAVAGRRILLGVVDGRAEVTS